MATRKSSSFTITWAVGSKRSVYAYASGSWQASYEKFFVYDGWNLVEEMTEIGSTDTSRYFVWGLDLSQSLQGAGGIGGLLATVDGSAAYLYCYDANGNVGQLVNAANGAIATKYEYDPYGKPIRADGSYAVDNPFRFSTKYNDDETELVYYGYRYYSTELGRWWNRDPYDELFGRLGVNTAIDNPYLAFQNIPVCEWDYLGLFGDGFNGAKTKRVWEPSPLNEDMDTMGQWKDVPVTYRGHSDFENVSPCSFDFTLEDKGDTSPYNDPERHFRDLPDSLRDLEFAKNDCDRDKFQRAMHRAQDFYSHWNKGYRWDPGNDTLPCWGYGHACHLQFPDQDMEAWNQANELTKKWIGQWRSNCCRQCGADCKWGKRTEGGCAADDVYP